MGSRKSTRVKINYQSIINYQLSIIDSNPSIDDINISPPCVTSGACIIGAGSSYYMSYLQSLNHSELARYSNTIYLSTLITFAKSFGAVTLGILINKYNCNIKLMAIIGSALVCSGILLSYLTVQYSFVLFSLTVGLLFGFGCGFQFMVPFSLVTKWFPDSKGKASSFVFIGAGIGCSVVPEIMTYYINPKNFTPEKPFSDNYPDEKYFNDKSLLERVPYSFLIIGVINCALSGLSILMMFDKEVSKDEIFIEQINQDEFSSVEKNEILDAKNIKDIEKKEEKPILSISQAVKIKEIYLLTIINSFAPIPLYVFLINYKNYGQTFIDDDNFLTLINTVGCLINLPTRMVWGFILDKISFKMTYMSLIIATMAMLFTVCFNEYFGNKFTFLIYYCIADLLICGTFVIMPVAYAKCFGHGNMFLINGLVSIFGCVGTILQSVLSSPIQENFGYFVLFSSINVFGLIAFICLAIFNVKDKEGKDI